MLLAFGDTLTFRDGSNISLFHNMMFDRLYKPFEIRKGISIPVGDYHYKDWRVAYTSSKARKFYYSAILRAGTFWSGHYSQPSAGAGVRVNKHIQSNIQWDRNVVNLTQGKFTTDLIGLRVDTAFSPLMFLQSFIQYNNDAKTFSSNIRYRFIHHPLSDFFIVYNEVRGIGGNAQLETDTPTELLKKSERRHKVCGYEPAHGGLVRIASFEEPDNTYTFP